VIFVHGCFWHQHSRRGCGDARRPKSNSAYWQPKLDRNIARDAEHIATLKKQGWKVLVVWDCETVDQQKLRDKLEHFLKTAI
jgi:DNA mismatch endonuclease (patch repair protein)